MEFRRALNGIGFLICSAFDVRKLIAIAPIDDFLEGCQFLNLGHFRAVLYIVQICYVVSFLSSFGAATTAAVARFTDIHILDVIPKTNISLYL